MKKRLSLIPLIVQDAQTKQVLSLFWCNGESVSKMKETGRVWRFSRSKGRQMMKGASSGNVQEIVSLSWDCDKDALLAVVRQTGSGACHTGQWSCFTPEIARQWGAIDELCSMIAQRKSKPSKGSYVASIVNKPKAIGAKLTEEAAELAQAIEKESDGQVAWEAADVLFFTLVALENRGIDMQKVIEELERRKKKQ